MQKKDAREDGRIVLAHGEVTGHCHEVLTETGSVPSVDQAQFFEVDGRRELIVLAPCELRHQEHSTERRTTLLPDGGVTETWVATGRVVSHAYPAPVRQGDVYLRPLGPGVWQHVQQQEWSGPQQWRAVAD